MNLARSLIGFVLAFTAGCAFEAPINPSFCVTTAEARKILDRDTAHAKPLARPLVIVGGFMDPGFAQWILSSDFRKYTHDNRVIGVSLGFSLDADDYRQRILRAVDQAFPNDNLQFTTEVDVIGYSMGGVAARYAALPGGRRLQIHRLFTISSPHQGANSAAQIPFDLLTIQKQMRRSSEFLNQINRSSDASALYPIYCYTCLGDKVIGRDNAAPPGQTPWWVSASALWGPHNGAFMDPRIQADILTRLRDEPPLAHDPATPIPLEAPAADSPAKTWR